MAQTLFQLSGMGKPHLRLKPARPPTPWLGPVPVLSNARGHRTVSC